MPPKRVEFASFSAARRKSSGTRLPTQEESNANMTSLLPTKTVKTSMFPSLTGEPVEGEDSDSDSGLTGASSDSEGLQGKGKAKKEKVSTRDASDEDEDGDEEETEWEDVFQAAIEPTPTASMPYTLDKIGDLQLTLDDNKAETSTGGKKRGVSSQERWIRAVTHCLHVQFLLFHGAIRNAWLCDLELHGTLLSHLTPNIMRDVEKFQARQGRKSDKAAVAKGVADPVVKLLGILIHWWKKKFTVSECGMRNNGYKTLSQFQTEKEQGDEEFRFTTGNRGQDGGETYTLFRSQGERIENLEELRRLARECKGSRDTGAMLFTALLRAIGLETRMVFSLQPLGFGFTRRESFTAARSLERQRAGGVPKKASSKGHRSKGKDVVMSDEEERNENEGGCYDSDADGGFFHEDLPDLHHKLKKPTYDNDLSYPIFWSEVYSPASDKWITVESIVLTILGFSPDLLAKFEPKGKKAADSKQVIAYVIAYTSSGTAKDVTAKYLAKNAFPGKTKGFRIPITNIPIYNHKGKVVAAHERDWFGSVMRGYRTLEHSRTEREKQEDNDLQGFILKAEKVKDEQKERISYYKNNPKYILERHLRRDEAVKPGKIPVKTFTVGKGDKAREERVYSKDDIAVCKTVESWYREGRVIKEGQQPLKMVKPRAATLNRKREIEEAKRDGETITQGLYSDKQTELYSPPPIIDGRIPRNSFGNIDIYVPSMIPPGAIHLPLKGLAKLARKLGVDHAEAVTGFEFKKQRAVPTIEGVIVAEENEDLLRDAWRAEEEEKRRRADGKKEKAALAMWRRFLMGLRIVKRLREEYGDGGDDAADINPFAVEKLRQLHEEQVYGKDGGEKEYEVDEGGGFFRGDGDYKIGGGFVRDDNDEADGGNDFPKEDSMNNNGGFQVTFDGEIEPNSWRKGGFLDPLQKSGAISLRDMATQKEKISKESTESDSDQEIEQSTTSPEIRSAYFMNDAAPNSPCKSKKPMAPSNSDDERLKPLNKQEGSRLRPKTVVGAPATPNRVMAGRKIRAAKPNEVSNLGPAPDPTPDIGMPSGTTTRRVSKRKAVAEAEKKQSKYFMEGGNDSGSEGEGQKRRNKKLMKRG